jgi:hypothetical protein
MAPIRRDVYPYYEYETSDDLHDQDIDPAKYYAVVIVKQPQTKQWQESPYDHSNDENRIFLSTTNGLLPASSWDTNDGRTGAQYMMYIDEHQATKRRSVTLELLPYVRMRGDNDNTKKGRQTRCLVYVAARTAEGDIWQKKPFGNICGDSHHPYVSNIMRNETYSSIPGFSTGTK